MVRDQRNTVGAILLIGLGMLFLIGQVFNINFGAIAGVSWPVFVLIPGVIFLALAFVGDQKTSGLIFPGAVITGTGAILWYQNMTNNWQSWAYIWALYPVFVGMALVFHGRRTANSQEIQTGRNLTAFGTIAFLVGAAFFELVIFGSNSALTGLLAPLVLIGVGGYLLMTGRVGGEKRKTDDPVFTDARMTRKPLNKRSNGRLSPSDDLQRQIDDALAEDQPDEPEPML